MWIYLFKKFNSYLSRCSLILTSLIAGAVSGDIILFIGRTLGYGYAGTLYLEPASISANLFKLLMLISMCFHKATERENLHRDIAVGALVVSLVFSEFAILSGRLMILSCLFYGFILFDKNNYVLGFKISYFTEIKFLISTILNVLFIIILYVRFS